MFSKSVQKKIVTVQFNNGPPQLFIECEQIMQFYYVGEQSALTHHAGLTRHYGTFASFCSVTQ